MEMLENLFQVPGNEHTARKHTRYTGSVRLMHALSFKTAVSLIEHTKILAGDSLAT